MIGSGFFFFIYAGSGGKIKYRGKIGAEDSVDFSPDPADLSKTTDPYPT